MSILMLLNVANTVYASRCKTIRTVQQTQTEGYEFFAWSPLPQEALSNSFYYPMGRHSINLVILILKVLF